MSLPSNGVPPDLSREAMPPYRLGSDLLAATFAALPPPPPNATAAWREAQIMRLIQEISALMPANAAQARMAAQIVVMQELAGACAAQLYASPLTVPEMCRAKRTMGELVRTAAGMMRMLKRMPRTPAPLAGMALDAKVDVAAAEPGGCQASDRGLPCTDPCPQPSSAALPRPSRGGGTVFVPRRAGPIRGASENPDINPMNPEGTPEATPPQGGKVVA